MKGHGRDVWLCKHFRRSNGGKRLCSSDKVLVWGSGGPAFKTGGKDCIRNTLENSNRSCPRSRTTG